MSSAIVLPWRFPTSSFNTNNFDLEYSYGLGAWDGSCAQFF